MSTAFQREPIFWTSTLPGYNDKDRTRVRFEGGEQIVEKVPQRGHVGDYENRRPAPGIRSVRVVRHDGHVVDSVLTSSAAQLDHTESQGQYIQAKWRHFGWFPLGNCPLALLSMGQIQPGHLRAKQIIGQTPCAHGSCNEKTPCMHALTELEARRTAQRARTAEIDHKFVERDQKMIDANANALEKLGDNLAEVIREVRAAHQPPEPPAADPKPKTKTKTEE